jgi:hypothetical protein
MYKVVEKNGKTQNGCNLGRCQRIYRLGHLGVDSIFHLGIRENVLAIYRAIKLICNRVIHGFESICLLRLI